MVKQMTELVKDGFDFAVAQKRGLIAHRWSHVTTDQAEMRRTTSVGPRSARDEIIHPRAASFRFARVPIRIKRPKMPLLAVKKVVELHLRVPNIDRPWRAFD